MDNKIISKFMLATEEGIEILLSLATEITYEKFGSITTNKILEQYIAGSFNRRTMIIEMNSLSNQWVVVFYNNEPVGYMRITSNGRRPQLLAKKRIIRLAEFGILKKYDDPQIPLSLLEKCLSVCRGYDGLWITEYAEHPLLPFFESNGFLRLQEVPDQYELPLPALYLFRENEK
ncbi:hypothetical protein A4H97_13975 [Niastella yeongjuensis]|uniref:N-acetyltransferase domain-containing protein n=2 Tax=Niastella yeongjuensis TaxID=354355 RepID=A0A1V9E5B1_9BACT|nr:hypothetical protein A4H97_13975 [Niastella yeongjuensis]